jgi:hypothetical protein
LRLFRIVVPNWQRLAIREGKEVLQVKRNRLVERDRLVFCAFQAQVDRIGEGTRGRQRGADCVSSVGRQVRDFFDLNFVAGSGGRFALNCRRGTGRKKKFASRSRPFPVLLTQS